MSSLPQLIQWRSPTAPPPQLKPVDPTTLALWREHTLNVHALFELTGVPTLYRWARAIWERRPIHEIEKEYFESIFRQLQQVGATAPRLEAPLRGVVPFDYVAEGRRAPPAQTPHLPEDVRKKMQALGVPTSPEDVAAQVAGRSAVFAAAVLPLGLAGLTKEAAKQLAKITAAGFGVGGTGAAATRAVQGFPEEAPRAFFEVGLASTVAADIANALKAVAAGVSAPQLRAAAQQVLRRRQEGGAWRDPEGEAFLKEIEEALLALKRGDTSRYDQLLRQMEEWRAKIDEFNRLYETRQKGRLPPEDEARYTKLLKEVSEIRDKYDLLKMYVETARELGLEAGARRAELERRMVSDLARAAQEMPPGPPRRDLMEWLQRIDFGFLQKLAKDPGLLSRYARRFGVDEQTLAERATLMLRERAWERLAELPPEELKKILMDNQLLKKYVDEYGIAEDKLRAFIEDALQRRMGVRQPPEKTQTTPTEPVKPPGRPPIEKRDQFMPPEVGAAEGAVVTREGQVLIVRPKEGGRVAAARVEELPDVQTRLRALLRRRLEERPAAARGVRDGETARTSDEQAPRVKEAGEQTPRARDEQVGAVRTSDAERAEAMPKTAAAEGEVLVLDRDALRAVVPALPAQVFAMPAPTVLAYISRVVGMPIALAPGIPKPSPREPFGSWLDRVFAGTGFSWRSLAAQRETFVFA